MSEAGASIGARYAAIAHQRLMDEIRQAELLAAQQQNAQSASKAAFEAIHALLKSETEAFNAAVGIDSEKMTFSSTPESIHFGVVRRRVATFEFSDPTLKLLTTEPLSPFAVPQQEFVVLGNLKFRPAGDPAAPTKTVEEIVDAAFEMLITGQGQA